MPRTKVAELAYYLSIDCDLVLDISELQLIQESGRRAIGSHYGVAQSMLLEWWAEG